MGEFNTIEKLLAEFCGSCLGVWYRLTAYLPRRVPTNADEWDELKTILCFYYGVPDEAPFWATVAGHVSSTEAGRCRRSYGYLANSAKHLIVVQEARKIQKQAGLELEARVKAAQAKMSEALAAETARVAKEKGEKESVADVAGSN